jgi:hypothetical protein
MVSRSAARTAQRWAASVRLSFKTGLLVSEAKAQQRGVRVHFENVCFQGQSRLSFLQLDTSDNDPSGPH